MELFKYLAQHFVGNSYLGIPRYDFFGVQYISYTFNGVCQSPTAYSWGAFILLFKNNMRPAMEIECVSLSYFYYDIYASHPETRGEVSSEHVLVRPSAL